MRRAVRALVFDFDGLIVDTEGPTYRAVQEVYRRHGQELPLAEWVQEIGTLGAFDAFGHLQVLTGEEGDGEAARRLYRRLKDELLEGAVPRPGVLDYLEEAPRRGLLLGIASSSSREWVEGWLERLGLGDRFQAVECADGDPRRAKPSPELYRAVLRRLEVAPEEAVALEDSPNGVTAAKTAGLFCVAVPHPLTASLDLAAADLVVPSLDDLPLEVLLARAAR